MREQVYMSIGILFLLPKIRCPLYIWTSRPSLNQKPISIIHPKSTLPVNYGIAYQSNSIDLFVSMS